MVFGGHFNAELVVDLLDGCFRILHQIIILDQDILAFGQRFEEAMGVDIPVEGLFQNYF